MSRPNIIWFLVDQMRTQSLGIAGDPNARTPTLDRLAREGTWFRQALSGSPLCSPARGAFLTSRYPYECVPELNCRIPEDQPLVSECFQDAGYHCAWFGKWHVDHHENVARPAEYTVPREYRRGFDTWIAYENNNQPWDCLVHGHRNNEEVAHYRLPGHETDCLTDLLLDWVGQHRDDPFFACVSVQPPHNPHVAPRDDQAFFSPAQMQLRPNVPSIPGLRDKAREEIAAYNASVHQIDRNVQRVVDFLQESGLSDSTYLVFFSDHGDLLGSHGHFRKQTPEEESIRIPFLIWGGSELGGAQAGGRCGKNPDALLNHVDVPVTTLGLAGLAPAADMRGYDYSGAVTGRPNPVPEPESAFLQLPRDFPWGPAPMRAWRGIVTKDGWKYVCREGAVWRCHHLIEDPYEEVDLAERWEVRHEQHRLQAILARWLDETGDEFRLPELLPLQR